MCEALELQVVDMLHGANKGRAHCCLAEASVHTYLPHDAVLVGIYRHFLLNIFFTLDGGGVRVYSALSIFVLDIHPKWGALHQTKK